jgi:isopentenyl-diphosphate delta-isomerase
MEIPQGDELLDLVDKNDNIIGSVLRSAAHTNTTFIHREILVYIFNAKGEVLLQQRGSNKKVNPSIWVESCAGHVEHN